MKKYKTVIEFLDDLESGKKSQVVKLQDIILDLGVELEESIKWNAPSYNYKGFDRITFNLLNKEDKVKVIIHMGTSRKEDKKAKPILENAPKFITWNSDIRGTITFNDIDDINDKKDDFKATLTAWLRLKV